MSNLVKPILILLLSLLPCALSAQTFVGFQGSNYAGIYAVDLQPAAIADNRLKYDISLIGLSTTVSNNYLSIAGGALTSGDFQNITSDNYKGFLLEKLNGRAKSLYLNYDIQLPGVMLALSPKQGIAITSRLRSFLNIDGLEEPGARFAFNLLDVPRQFGEVYSNPGLSVNLLNYFELGFGYGRVLYDEGAHFLKGGGRLKLLSGLAGASVYADSLRYSFLDDHTLSVQGAKISYAHSTILDGIENDFNVFRDFGQLRFNDVGFGVDLGLIYEYRPNQEEYYVGQGENRVPMKEKNKYAFRVGLSVLDIGGIPFKQSERGQNFSGSVIGYDLNQLDLKGVADFDSVIQAEFSMAQGGEDFTMALPTAVSLQLDIKLRNNLYVNLSPYFAFRRSGNFRSVHSITHVSLTPRWESKWLGFGVPISASDAGSVDVGFMLNAGPFVVGSANLASAVFGSNMQGADLRFGLRAPIPYKRTRADEMPVSTPKEKEREKISEARPERPEKEGKKTSGKRDKQKNEPVVTEKKSGITNRPTKEPVAEATTPDPAHPATPDQPTQTESPKEPEMANGPQRPVSTSRPAPATPQTPQIAAPPQVEQRAPAQQQPAVPGPQAERPDKAAPQAPAQPDVTGTTAPQPATTTTALPAGPGETERPDKTPKPAVEYGPIIVNKPTFSPERPFVNETTIQYLPYADADGDGILNQEDICPDIPGLAALQGCPPEEDPLMQHADYQQVEAFHRFYFDTGSTELGPFEKEMLRQVVFLLRDNPDNMLLIHGHADGSPGEKRNENLSRQRCETVRAYLVSKGIDQQRLIVVAHGSNQPASTNLSEKGRSLNRRVELVLEDQ